MDAWKTTAGKAKILTEMGLSTIGTTINMGSDLVEVFATNWFKTYFNTA